MSLMEKEPPSSGKLGGGLRNGRFLLSANKHIVAVIEEKVNRPDVGNPPVNLDAAHCPMCGIAVFGGEPWLTWRSTFGAFN